MTPGKGSKYREFYDLSGRITCMARAIATALRSMAAAIANKYVMRNTKQSKSNGQKAFRISPPSFNISLLIGWFYPGRIPNNGTAVRHQL